MKLLIINPNTTDAMTRKAEAAARAFLPPDVAITTATGRFGPRYIASRAAFAVAGHAALDLFAVHGATADAVLLACFGDPGLDALREVSNAPVIGLVEAAAREAGREGRRFAIVTGGVLWEPMLRESLMVRGLDRGLVAIRTVAPDGGTIARDPDGAMAVLAEACERCCRDDGAEAVILGGIGLLGLAERIQPSLPCPVICSVMAGLREVVAVQGRRVAARPVHGVEPAHGVESVGLSSELTGLLATGRSNLASSGGGPV